MFAVRGLNLMLTLAALPKLACHLSTRHGLTLSGKDAATVKVAISRPRDTNRSGRNASLLTRVNVWGVHLPLQLGYNPQESDIVSESERGCVVINPPQHTLNLPGFETFHALRLVFDTAALHF